MQSKENKYAANHKRIRKHREYFAYVNMNELLYLKGREKGVAMRSRYFKVNGRGRLPLSHTSYVEQ